MDESILSSIANAEVSIGLLNYAIEKLKPIPERNNLQELINQMKLNQYSQWCKKDSVCAPIRQILSLLSGKEQIDRDFDREIELILKDLKSIRTMLHESNEPLDKTLDEQFSTIIRAYESKIHITSFLNEKPGEILSKINEYGFIDDSMIEKTINDQNSFYYKEMGRIAEVSRAYDTTMPNECLYVSLNEMKIHSKLNHKLIAPFWGVVKEGQFIKIIIPHNNNLKQEKDIDNDVICYGVACAMSYLHSEGIIHGNLSSNCIKIEKGYPIIYDFSYSIDTHDKSEIYLIKTKMDVLSKEETKGERPTMKSDVYAYGRLLIDLFTGNSLEENIDSKNINDIYRGIIENCIDIDPSKRLSFPAIVKKLYKSSISEFHSELIKSEMAKLSLYDITNPLEDFQTVIDCLGSKDGKCVQKSLFFLSEVIHKNNIPPELNENCKKSFSVIKRIIEGKINPEVKISILKFLANENDLITEFISGFEGISNILLSWFLDNNKDWNNDLFLTPFSIVLKNDRKPVVLNKDELFMLSSQLLSNDNSLNNAIGLFNIIIDRLCYDHEISLIGIVDGIIQTGLLTKHNNKLGNILEFMNRMNRFDIINIEMRNLNVIDLMISLISKCSEEKVLKFGFSILGNLINEWKITSHFTHEYMIYIEQVVSKRTIISQESLDFLDKLIKIESNIVVLSTKKSFTEYFSTLLNSNDVSLVLRTLKILFFVVKCPKCSSELANGLVQPLQEKLHEASQVSLLSASCLIPIIKMVESDLYDYDVFEKYHDLAICKQAEYQISVLRLFGAFSMRNIEMFKIFHVLKISSVPNLLHSPNSIVIDICLKALVSFSANYTYDNQFHGFIKDLVLFMPIERYCLDVISIFVNISSFPSGAIECAQHMVRIIELLSSTNKSVVFRALIALYRTSCTFEAIEFISDESLCRLNQLYNLIQTTWANYVFDIIDNLLANEKGKEYMINSSLRETIVSEISEMPKNSETYPKLLRIYSVLSS